MSRLAKKLAGCLQPGQPYKKGGEVKGESKKTAKEEIAVFEKAGRKDLVKHEKAEHGMKKGGVCKKCGGKFIDTKNRQSTCGPCRSGKR